MVKAKTTMNKRALNDIRSGVLEALEQTVSGSHESILSEIASAQVVPKQTGELERSAWVDRSGIRKGKVKIVYDTPYARRLYFHPEFNFRQDKNRNAQGLWLEAWQQENEGFFAKTFKKLWKKLSGGFIK